MHWGKHKENGLWFAKAHQFKLMIGNGRLIYLAIGRFRFRLVKWHNAQNCDLCP